MTTAFLLGVAIEFAIQTAFLFVGLLIMIKLQDLDFKVLGLLGASALTIGIEMILDHYTGINISTLVVVTVLLVSVKKVTGADHVDVGFTVAVGSALAFAMNMWLIGMLMGDLRASARSKMADVTAARATNHVAVATTRTAVTNAPAPTAEELARKQAQEVADGFSLKSITQSATEPMAMFQTGTKTYTLAQGESMTVQTPKGKVNVLCKRVESDKVILEIYGEETILHFSLGGK